VARADPQRRPDEPPGFGWRDGGATTTFLADNPGCTRREGKISGKFKSRAALTALVVALAGQAMAVEWNVSLWGERRASTEHVHKLAELVEEKTGGDFTMNINYGGLSSERENLDGIAIEAFEMAQFCVGYHADKTPSLTVLELPFLGVSTLEEDAAVSQAVYRHPAATEDLGRWNARLLMTSPTPRHNLVGTGEPRDSLEEFKGMRVRVSGGLGKAVELAGAVPTPVTSAEAYDAMESGVVDTVAFAPDAHLSFGTIDLATWWTENLDPGSLNCPIAISLSAYEALAPEQREVLESSVDEAVEHYMRNYRELLDQWDALLDQKGVQRVRFPDGELAKFRELASPVREQWIADMDARGIPGQELYDLVQATLRDHRARN
jgi:TRAP-type C4-dicarboxylate transport system substrate-binding protein